MRLTFKPDDPLQFGEKLEQKLTGESISNYLFILSLKQLREKTLCHIFKMMPPPPFLRVDSLRQQEAHR